MQLSRNSRRAVFAVLILGASLLAGCGAPPLTQEDVVLTHQSIAESVKAGDPLAARAGWLELRDRGYADEAALEKAAELGLGDDAITTGVLECESAIAKAINTTLADADGKVTAKNWAGLSDDLAKLDALEDFLDEEQQDRIDALTQAADDDAEREAEIAELTQCYNDGKTAMAENRFDDARDLFAEVQESGITCPGVDIDVALTELDSAEKQAAADALTGQTDAENLTLKAEGIIDAAVSEQEAGNYPLAAAKLTEAAALDAKLNRSYRRKLARLDDITDKMEELTECYDEGKAALAENRFDDARELFEEVKESGITCPGVANIDDALAELGAAEKKAGETLANGEDEERKAKQAAKDRTEKAEVLIDAAVSEQEAGNYPLAAAKLTEAAALDAKLNRSYRRKLARLDDITEDIVDATKAYNDGKAAYDDKNYDLATKLLQDCTGSCVLVGTEMHTSAGNMLTEISGRKAEFDAAKVKEMLERSRATYAKSALVRKLRDQARAEWNSAIAEWQKESYSEAKKHLVALDKTLAADVLTEVSQIDGIRKRAKELLDAVDTKIQIAELIAEAVKIADEKLLEAEKLARQAHTLSRGSASLHFSEAQEDAYRAIMDKGEGEFGKKRDVLRAQYNRLPDMIRQYRAQGRLNEATDLLNLLANAPVVLAREADITWADTQLKGVLSDAKNQKQLATRLLQDAQKARDRLVAGGDVAEALDATRRALCEAIAAKLVGEHMAGIAGFASETASKHAAGTIKKNTDALNKLVDKSLGAAQDLVKERRAAIVAGATPTLEEAENIVKLVELFARLVKEERVAQAREAQIRCAAAQASLALRACDYARARQLLDGAPVAEAGNSRAVRRDYRPVDDRLKGLAELDAVLTEVEAALSAHKLDVAAKALAQAGRMQQSSPLLDLRRSALGDVLKPVRDALADGKIVASLRDSITEQAKAVSADLAERSKIRQALLLANTTLLLKGDIDAGGKAFTKASRAGELLPFEKQHVEDVRGVAASKDIAAVDAALDTTANAIKQRRYVRANEWLTHARTLRGMKIDDDVVARADDLGKRIAKAEADAEALWAQIVEAMQQSDRKKTNKLYKKFSTQYRNTNVFRKRLEEDLASESAPR